jgi:hypothetical protein
LSHGLFVFLIQQRFPLLLVDNVTPSVTELTPIHTKVWCSQFLNEYGRVSARPDEPISRRTIYVSSILSFRPIVETFLVDVAI